MTLKKQKESQNITSILQQSRNFEISLADQAKKSERRAWLVATGAVLMSICLAGGMAFLVPLKEKIPYLVMADPYSGNATVARLTDDYRGSTITQSEAINKSNVAHFVIARESYDWDLINRRDWHTVSSMAATNVATEYQQQFEPTNPKNPDTLYGMKKAMRVKIKTIVLTGATTQHGPTGATVRFDRIVVDKQSGKPESTDSQIATLAFEYKVNVSMPEELRVENPLGFRVISYRVDPENNSLSSTILGSLTAQQSGGVEPNAGSMQQ